MAIDKNRFVKYATGTAASTAAAGNNDSLNYAPSTIKYIEYVCVYMCQLTRGTSRKEIKGARNNKINRCRMRPTETRNMHTHRSSASENR